MKQTSVHLKIMKSHKISYPPIKGLEVKNGRKFGKFTDMWKFKTTLLKRSMNRSNYKGNLKVLKAKIYQNLGKSSKSILRGKLIAININIYILKKKALKSTS